jgi:hypothetical protein
MSAVQLSSDPHRWTDLSVLDVPPMQCYVLRGVSPRLAKQQQERAWRQQQRQMREQQQQNATAATAAAEQVAMDAAVAAASDATDAAAASFSSPSPFFAAMVPAPHEEAVIAAAAEGPKLLEDADVPDFQFVLPTDCRRQWKHDTSESNATLEPTMYTAMPFVEAGLGLLTTGELFFSVCAFSFPLFFAGLGVPSLLVSVFTAPSFLSFMAVHQGCFHVLPRALLAKDGTTATGTGTGANMLPLGSALGAMDGGDDDAAASGPGSAEGAALLSRRQAKKRKIAEQRSARNAQQPRLSPFPHFDNASSNPPPPSAAPVAAIVEQQQQQPLVAEGADAEEPAADGAVEEARPARRQRRVRQNE